MPDLNHGSNEFSDFLIIILQQFTAVSYLLENFDNLVDNYIFLQFVFVGFKLTPNKNNITFLENINLSEK